MPTITVPMKLIYLSRKRSRENALVILHPTGAGVQKAKGLLETWLSTMGLELKPSKTKITHTLREYQGNMLISLNPPLCKSWGDISGGRTHAFASQNILLFLTCGYYPRDGFQEKEASSL